MSDPIVERTWWLLLLCAAATGGAIGSFLNVVAHRMPEGRSVVHPPSACPRCGRGIRPWHNIPVLGWLLLRGRCYDCSLPISPRYPLVEAGVAVLWALLFLDAAPDAESLTTTRRWLATPVVGLYVSALVAITLIDAEHRIIPPVLSWPLVPLGILAAVASDQLGLGLCSVPESISGALLGGAGMMLLSTVGRWIFRRDALGEGDAHLMAAVGAWQGPWPALPMTLFLASLVGSVVGIIILRTRGAARPPHLPFGPMLCGAAFVLWLSPDLWGLIVPVP